MNAKILTITPDNFNQEVLKSDLPVLLDFWAPWCAYCRKIGPAIDELADEAEGSLVVGEINVDEQPLLAKRFNVETIPSLLLLQRGAQKGDKLVAPRSRDALDEWLENKGIERRLTQSHWL